MGAVGNSSNVPRSTVVLYWIGILSTLIAALSNWAADHEDGMGWAPTAFVRFESRAFKKGPLNGQLPFLG